MKTTSIGSSGTNNPNGKRTAAIVVLGLFLLTASLISLLTVQSVGNSAPEIRYTFVGVDTSPTSTSSRPALDDSWPIDANTRAAFQFVRGSSINDDPLAAAASFLNGSLQVGRYGARDVTNGVDWSGTEESSSYLRLLHGQFILKDLVKAYEETADMTYLEAAYSHVRSWETANPIDDAASRMAWHDETTALRLTNWLVLLTASDDYENQESVDQLWQSAKAHAALLQTAEFHSTGTNHGMFQDQALLAYASVTHDREDAAAILDLARSRLLSYFNDTISSDGVHLEHSPSYHQLIAATILRYQDYFDTIGDSMAAGVLAATEERMARYATYVIQPDGSLPLIGDTFAGATPNPRLFPGDNEYLFARTAGKEGERPTDLSAVFPEAGYAIFRDRWSEDGDGIGTYVHFTAAYHGSYHKHSDELSVWLYHDGELLTESGPNGYDMNDPTTQFAYSSNSHNTLLMDGQGLPRVDGNFDNTYLENFDLDENAPSATGVTTRYEGIRWVRTVLLDRVGTKLIVTDRIDTETPHEFTFLWHLAPGIEATVDADNRVQISRFGLLVARLTVDSSDTTAVTTVIVDNPSRSLRLGGGTPEPTSLITITFQTENRAELTTTFELFR